MVSDSVDRNALGHLADLTDSPCWPSDYADSRHTNPLPQGWDERGLPYTTYIASMDLRIVNGFFYGLDDIDDFQHQPDWHAPGLAEDRIEQLFYPFTKSLPHAPDFIQIHSGMWDLALWGRQDSQLNQLTDVPLDWQRLKWWRHRMLLVIAKVREHWPGTPIWYRKIHRIGSPWAHSTQDYLFGLDHDQQRQAQNFFTDIRIHQLRELQESVAAEVCLPIFDFGHLWEGYQSQQDKVRAPVD